MCYNQVTWTGYLSMLGQTPSLDKYEVQHIYMDVLSCVRCLIPVNALYLDLVKMSNKILKMFFFLDIDL